MSIPYVMILCLAVTIILEVIIALIIKIQDKIDLINVVLVNVLTNPLLISTSYLIFFKFGKIAVSIFEVVMEILIWIVEGIIYKKYLKYKKINPFLVSLLLNLGSYFIGGIIINSIYQ